MEKSSQTDKRICANIRAIIELHMDMHHLDSSVMHNYARDIFWKAHMLACRCLCVSVCVSLSPPSLYNAVSLLTTLRDKTEQRLMCFLSMAQGRDEMPFISDNPFCLDIVIMNIICLLSLAHSNLLVIALVTQNFAINNGIFAKPLL